MYVFGAQKNHFIETVASVLLSTQTFVLVDRQLFVECALNDTYLCLENSDTLKSYNW